MHWSRASFLVDRHLIPCLMVCRYAHSSEAPAQVVHLMYFTLVPAPAFHPLLAMSATDRLVLACTGGLLSFPGGVEVHHRPGTLSPR